MRKQGCIATSCDGGDARLSGAPRVSNLSAAIRRLLRRPGSEPDVERPVHGRRPDRSPRREKHFIFCRSGSGSLLPAGMVRPRNRHRIGGGACVGAGRGSREPQDEELREFRMSLPLKDQTWYGKTFLALLALLMIVAVVARWRLEPIAPADAAAQGFSAARAKQVLATVLGDERPHPIDSVAEAGVRERIVGALDRIGYHADVQDATACREIPVHTCARVRNIVALREGTTAGRAILLSAHYDSVPAGPGASDDGSGVAALLEIARLLKQQPPSKNPVVLLFTDGEEPGLLGARAFMAEHPLASKIAFAINLEARGTSGQSAMFETGDASGWLIDKYAASAKRPLANSLLSTVYKLMPNDTDLSVFKAHGLQGLNFAYGEHVSY